MPRLEKLGRAAAIRETHARISAPNLYAWRLIVSRHEASEDGVQCSCGCKSILAREVARRTVDVRLIDPRSQESWLRSKQTDPGEFDELVATAESVDLVIRCTAETEPALLDYENSTFLYSGGIRSGKTSEDVNGGVIDVFFLGGAGEIGRFGGPTIKKAHIFLAKLVTGEGPTKPDPLIDPRLVVSYPKSDRDADQNVYLIDGTRLHFTHCRSVDEWQGEALITARITEAANVRIPEILIEAQGRVTDRGGRAGFDSIPLLRTPFDEMIVAAKQSESEDKLGADKPPGRGTRLLELSSERNPWQPSEEMAGLRAKIAKTNPQQARRVIDGVRASDYEALFQDVWDETTGTFDTYFQDPRKIESALAEIGKQKGYRLTDVTRIASRRHFYRGHDWLIGADANFEPHTALVCKIVAFGEPSDQANWGLLVWDELRTNRADTLEAANHLAQYEQGLLRGQGVSLDASEDFDKSYRGGRRGVTGVMDYKSAGFNCKPCNRTEAGKSKNPDVAQSTRLVKHLMRERLVLVSAKCFGLLRALREQEDRGDGRPKDPRLSNTWTDREIYAFTDALRYIVWPVFGPIVERKLLGSSSTITF